MKRLLMAIPLCLLLISCAPGSPRIQPSIPKLTQHQLEDLEDYCYEISDAGEDYADCMLAGELPQPKLKILDTNHKRDSIGNLIIVGTVKNIGKVRARFAKVSCRGYTSNGNLVDVDITYTKPSSLGAGDDGIFTSYLDETKPISKYNCKPIID